MRQPTENQIEAACLVLEACESYGPNGFPRDVMREALQAAERLRPSHVSYIELMAERAALQSPPVDTGDRERLDWLEASLGGIGTGSHSLMTPSRADPRWLLIGYDRDADFTGSTLREAIDNAREAK